MGVTVIVASGDDGAPGYNTKCSTKPNKLGYGTVTTLDASPLLPSYPAASAYVLSVGETDFLQSATSKAAALASFTTAVTSPAICNNCPTDQRSGYLCQETSLGEEPVSLAAASQLAETTTGGGFSLIYPRPSWQNAAVNSYLKGNCTAANGCTLPKAADYYSANRGFVSQPSALLRSLHAAAHRQLLTTHPLLLLSVSQPDVSAFGGYFPLVFEGEEAVVSGTSVAAPLWCGFISRMNEVNLARKGTTLGFVNPLLYSMWAAQPSTFHDLKTGENFCPEGNTKCVDKLLKNQGSTTCSGFYAAPGWDPVTGLGSPNHRQHTAVPQHALS